MKRSTTTTRRVILEILKKISQPSKIDYAAKIFELQEFGLHAIYMKCEFSFRFCFSPDFVLAIFVISL